jgi:hypothetical protein
VLRKHPELGHCLVRCRYCGIRFLTHPCNARRRDLLCPFGCRKEHRRQSANRRSAEHYQTPKGRKNKKARNGQRSCGEQSCHGGSQFAGLADLAPPDDSAASNSCDGESDQPTSDPSAPGGQPVDLADASATFNARSGKSDQPTSVMSAPMLTSAEYSETTPPCRGGLLLEGVRLNAASVVNSPLLPYLQLVASCIERRKIGRDELVQALLRTLRQRSLSAGPRTTYVLAYLNRHPPEEQWHE